MQGVKIDIDIIFESLEGRYIVLLSEKGTVINANPDALNLIGEQKIDSVFRSNWDDCFGKLSSEGFSFANIVNATTGFLSIEITESNGEELSLEVKVDTLELNKDYPGKYYLIVCRKQHSGEWEDMLFRVMKGTEKDFGEDFINAVTKSLAQTLKTDFAFIGKLVSGAEDHIQTLSFWNKADYRKNFEYTLAGSPCEDVVDKNQKLIPRNVAKLYPADKGLAKLGVESYFGTPIYYSDGSPLGLLVVMDSKPMQENSSSAYILNIFASRIGVEIEWMESQRSLVEKDRKLRGAINAIPHPIYFKNKAGLYEGVNQAFARLVGLNEEDIIGQTLINKINEVDSDSNSDQQLLNKPGNIAYESKAAGTNKEFLFSKSSIVDDQQNIEGMVGSATDITELKKAEKELIENEEKYRNLFSSANDAIFIMSDDKFIDCNDKTLEMFDCTREEIIGFPPYDFSPSQQPDGRDSKEKAIEKINDALAGQAQNFYWKHKKKTGGEFDAEVSLNAFYIDTNLHIQAIVRDVTDKYQLSRNTAIQMERMEAMYKHISSPMTSFKDQIASLMKLATRSLGMDAGILSRIEDDKYFVLDSYGLGADADASIGHELENTYCSITYKNNRLVAFNDISNSKHLVHPAKKLFEMEAYIGAPYWVKGQRSGTLAFISKNPVNRFQAVDLDFVQMLAQWVGSTMERIQFEENLLERDALLETMLREIPIDFSVRNANLDMVIQSDLSKEYWGNLEGKPIDFSDVDKASAIKWQGIFKQALAGKITKGEDFVEINGKPHYFFSIASPIIVKNKVTDVITINLDISRIRETQQKLKDQNEQLTKLNSELDRFVYSASHDLRAPLASLLGLIDLTERENDKDSIGHYLELMKKSISTMDSFIADITEYSRNLRLDTISDEIDFKKLFATSFEHVQFMIPGPGKYEIKIKGSPPFYSDYERLKMVINNIISNSLRYKAYNRDPFLDFDVKLTKKQAVIEITDNGLGIEEKHLGKVFDMFYRANENNAGSGLGLFIVKETIEKLGGNVSISSTVDIGTTIRIELPNHPAPTN